MNVQSPLPLLRKGAMSERKVSVIGAILVAVGPISMALFTPAMPEIGRVFDSPDSAVKLTLSLYFAGFALAQLVCGPLSDGLGRRPVTIAFMSIYLAASVAALLAPSIEVLIAARFLQGVGAAAGIAISRAIVRDLFTSDSAVRIMNLIGIILSIGPALAPTLGGLTLEFFGWHAIFLLMVGLGAAIMLVVIFSMRETVERDLSRIRPRELLRSYATLLGSPYFLLCSLTIAGSVGAIYTQATLLPFILMERVGLTPTQFGVGMLSQSGMYLLGSLTLRFMMPRFGAYRLVPVGLVCIAIGGAALAVLLNIAEPRFITVMGPVGVYTFGIAFVTSAMLTAALLPFPRIAGAAASMSGFFQMGAGLLGGIVGALIGDPVLAMSIVIPAMGSTAIVAWLFWRRLALPIPVPPPLPDMPGGV